MVRVVRIYVMWVISVMLVGGLCLLPVSGMAAERDYTNGSMNPGDPRGGDGFYEGIPGGGGGSIGDDSPPEGPDLGPDSRIPFVMVPIMWSPAGGWLILIPDGIIQQISNLKKVHSSREWH